MGWGLRFEHFGGSNGKDFEGADVLKAMALSDSTVIVAQGGLIDLFVVVARSAGSGRRSSTRLDFVAATALEVSGYLPP